MRWRKLDWSVIGWVLFAKLALFVFGWFAVPALSGRLTSFFETWGRWDAVRYLQIARDGYTASGEARFNLVGLPFYPWLVRSVSWFGFEVPMAALLVSAVASLAAGLLLVQLVRQDEGEEAALSAVWFLFVYPTSYFLHIAYTEATLLALTLACFLAARRNLWELAGLLGGLAALTRWQGLILLPALACEIGRTFRLTRRFDLRWLWLALIPCGFGVYLLLNYHVTGDAFAFMKLMRENFYRELAPPWVGFGNLWSSMNENGPEYFMMAGVAEIVFALLGLAMMIWSWFALRASYAVWITGNMLLCLCSSFIQAVPRYTLVMFPIFILLARATRGRPLRFAMISMTSLLLLTLLLSKFVLGHWAF